MSTIAETDRAAGNGAADDQAWPIYGPPPEGATLENCRKAGRDEVRIRLRSPHSRQAALAFALFAASSLLLVGYWANALWLATIAVLVSAGAWSWREQSSPYDNWLITVGGGAFEIHAFARWSRSERRSRIKYTALETIEIERADGREASLVITTNSGTHRIGHGLSEKTLQWLKGYLTLEISGLTWRPIPPGEHRGAPAKNDEIVNPVLLKPDLAIRLIDIFLTQSAGVVRQLRTSLDAGDANSVRRHAHWLKSTSANVGARHLSEICQLVELYAVDGTLAPCRVLCAEIELKLPGVECWLKNVRDSAATTIVKAKPGAMPASGASLASAQWPAARVLVVDDSAVSLEIAQDTLSDLVEAVDIARDGLEAVAMWREREYELIFMDCEMLGMSGPEATREIRRLERETGRHKVPIVALTGNVLESQKAEALDSGMDDYITKPYAPSTLEAALRKWLSHQSGVAALREAHRELRGADQAGQTDVSHPSARDQLVA